MKYYDGDIEELSLNFTMAVDELGQSKVQSVWIIGSPLYNYKSTPEMRPPL